MTKMNTRPPRFNPDYPGFIVPEVMCKTQMEIIEMVEKGEFPDATLTRTAQANTEAVQVRK
jgi:hypothetical protein